MATTRMLNDNQTVWVTTYFGGIERGTRFDISMQLSAEEQVTATFTVESLMDILKGNGRIQGLAKPDLDDDDKFDRQNDRILDDEEEDRRNGVGDEIISTGWFVPEDVV